MRAIRRLAIVVSAATLLAAAANGVAGQLPNPSAVSLGMGENHTAVARGFSAISLNPAGLRMPDGPRASGTILALRGVAGLGPVGAGDLAEYDGRSIPEDVRRRWLEQIEASRGEHGAAGGDVTYLAAHVGPVGVQVATTAHLVGELGPGAAQLLLFGNAGRTGEPVDVALGGTSFDVVVASTAGFSYAHPIIREGERALSLGATVKYTVGHLMLTAVDLGSEATADPLGIRIDLPIVQTDTLAGLGGRERGSGVGLDLGVAWQGGRLRGGLVVKNLFNTFAWNEERLFFRPGAVSVTGEARTTDFEPQPFSAAPASVRERVRNLNYPMVVAAGVAYEARGDLRVSADLRQRLGSGQRSEPATHLGAGAEYRPLGWLPLRAGVAVISNGFLVSAGVGLEVAAVRLDLAGARRGTDVGTASVGMLSFSLQSR